MRGHFFQAVLYYYHKWLWYQFVKYKVQVCVRKPLNIHSLTIDWSKYLVHYYTSYCELIALLQTE